MRPENVPRKYVDLIRQTSNNWGIWDPSNAPKVGSYGQVNYDTGEMEVEGNVYDPEFQQYVDEVDGRMKMTDYPPVWSEVKQDVAMASLGVRRGELKPGPDAPPGVATASLKGHWTFQKGRCGGLLVLYQPREESLPADDVLEELYKIPLLKDKLLITNVTHCPAYSLYVSGKDGETLSLALKGSREAGSEEPDSGLEWWVDPERERPSLRTECSMAGDYCFTPLFDLRRKLPLIRRLMRDSPPPDPKAEGFWCGTSQPWQPLDEDGEEDPVYDYDDMTGTSILLWA
ncbi:hypothetical protein HYDPIDRAFT_112945 [Hydnomerulius pinastri MD-312]|uniref:Unplaced genomic scaffold scaffold_16, whole genome shotgun sequence n=1 Tax=Hydnomerulius pinastri MD-312 TaxID=994086 RepID=A0A0C9VD71_9AGAM|nr:hypothetical protein HYDPIDRAFT_112945 [Hydnomerulius pinastri MD-312]